jgi:hypothetical protein
MWVSALLLLFQMVCVLCRGGGDVPDLLGADRPGGPRAGRHGGAQSAGDDWGARVAETKRRCACGTLYSCSGDRGSYCMHERSSSPMRGTPQQHRRQAATTCHRNIFISCGAFVAPLHTSTPLQPRWAKNNPTTNKHVQTKRVSPPTEPTTLMQRRPQSTGRAHFRAIVVPLDECRTAACMRRRCA